ncbi:MAG TPA: hypothetical protein VLC92_18415 [Rhodocyclaceae bacterium]|nr:hypothetical protein [Rhodocyclaceae bacterium]
MKKRQAGANARSRVLSIAITTLAAVLLGSCGGGGSGGDPGAEAARQVAIATVCIPPDTASSSSSVSGTSVRWAIDSGASRSYSEIPLAGDDTINPGRGYHRWIDRELVPQAAPAPVVYNRFIWRDLEPSQDNYDFSALINEARTAKAAGKKYAFALRMMIGPAETTVYLPAYAYKNPLCAHECGFVSIFTAGSAAPVSAFVPDWNDPWLQGRARKLLEALRDRLALEKIELAWLDVALWGQWGEWYTSPNYYFSPPIGTKPAGIEPITSASKEAFARMYFETFPNEQLLMHALREHSSTLTWAFTQTITKKPVGLRTNCLGKNVYPGSPLGEWNAFPADFAAIQDRWKLAPFVAELCAPDSGNLIVDTKLVRKQIASFHISTIGNGGFGNSIPDMNARWGLLDDAQKSDMLMAGRETGYRYLIGKSSTNFASDGSLLIQATLQNAGNTPSYEDWSVRLEMLDGDGAVVASTPTAISLKDSPGACSKQNIDLTWNPVVPAGSYTIRLVGSHAYWPNLKWTNLERNTDGSLTLAKVVRKP